MTKTFAICFGIAFAAVLGISAFVQLNRWNLAMLDNPPADPVARKKLETRQRLQAEIREVEMNRHTKMMAEVKVQETAAVRSHPSGRISLTEQEVDPAIRADLEMMISKGQIKIRQEGMEVFVAPLVWNLATYEAKQGFVVSLIRYTKTYPTVRDLMTGRELASTGPIMGIKILP